MCNGGLILHTARLCLEVRVAATTNRCHALVEWMCKRAQVCSPARSHTPGTSLDPRVRTPRLTAAPCPHSASRTAAGGSPVPPKFEVHEPVKSKASRVAPRHTRIESSSSKRKDTSETFSYAKWDIPPTYWAEKPCGLKPVLGSDTSQGNLENPRFKSNANASSNRFVKSKDTYCF